MQFWIVDMPALVITAIWRVYFVIVSAVLTLTILTVLIMFGALILGLPVPFVGLPPHSAP